MLYFPQLASGGTAQYPVQKSYNARTIINTCEDGHTVKLFDAGATNQQWTFPLQDLTDAELNTLQTFFSTCEGQLNPFTFLDPLSNLLMWSDMLDQAAWQSSTVLQIEPGIDDPIGGTMASRLINPSAADLTLQQTVNAPGWFFYCFSVYARSQSGNISLFLQAGSAISTRTIRSSGLWSRISNSAELNTTAESLSAGIVIPAGQSLYVYGFQLEPQPAASAYKQSFGTGGIYPIAHFANDIFTFTTDGPNRHHCTVKVTVP